MPSRAAVLQTLRVRSICLHAHAHAHAERHICVSYVYVAVMQNTPTAGSRFFPVASATLIAASAVAAHRHVEPGRSVTRGGPDSKRVARRHHRSEPPPPHAQQRQAPPQVDGCRATESVSRSEWA